MFEPLLQVCEYPCTDARSRPLVWLIIFGTAWLLAAWVAQRKKGGKSMKAVWNVVVVVVLLAAIAGVFALKRAGKGSGTPVSPETPAVPTAAPGAESRQPDNAATATVSQALPRLLELGGAKCIPCQMMMPVLDELKKEYAGRLSVEFYDVQKDPSLGVKYGIRLIPTQILYDASGKELFRHVGLFAKEDILAKWKELGVDLAGPAR